MRIKNRMVMENFLRQLISLFDDTFRLLEEVYLP